MSDTDLDRLSVDTSAHCRWMRSSSQVGAPRHTDGAGAARLHPLEPRDALRSEDPIWPNRDRFVLSNGHASMLLWSVLHLTGTRAVNGDYERLGQPSVSLDDIRRFRQIGSKAPGHPEYHWCRVSRPRPARSGRASRRASGWPSPASGSPTVTTDRAS